MINQSMYELYDLLINVYEDYFLATPVQFITTGGTNFYAFLMALIRSLTALLKLPLLPHLL